MPEESHNHQASTINFVHVTDCHLLDHPDEAFHGINTASSLHTVLSHCVSCYPDIDFILFTGDISQTGRQQSYSVFNKIIQPYKLPVYCVPGNHDTPGLLQQIIPSSPDNTISIIQLGMFSLILINSSVEGRHHGRLTRDCLLQLEQHLYNSEDQFNIIALHHPPVLINSQWLDELGLQNKIELMQLISRHRQNTLLLSGHIHQELDISLDRLRILSTPSTCHQFEPNSDDMHRANGTPPAYRYVRLSTSNEIVTKVHYAPDDKKMVNIIRGQTAVA